MCVSKIPENRQMIDKKFVKRSAVHQKNRRIPRVMLTGFLSRVSVLQVLANFHLKAAHAYFVRYNAVAFAAIFDIAELISSLLSRSSATRFCRSLAYRSAYRPAVHAPANAKRKRRRDRERVCRHAKNLGGGGPAGFWGPSPGSPLHTQRL